MRRTCSIVALCFAWLCANGALWDCVQVFAWGKMLHDYSRIMPLETAVEKTFDGSMPCELCMAVERAKQQETPPAQQVERSAEKVLLALHAAEPIIVPAPEYDWPGAADRTGVTRTDPVPAPPPRV